MDNQSVYTNDTLAEPPPFVGIKANAKIVLYGILLVWSLLGNILVIAVVLGNKHLRTNFNYLIVNMAVSDLFNPLLALPIKITEEAGGRPGEWLVDGILGNALCKLCYFFSDISPAVSVFSLVIMAVNRFVATVFPVRSFNERRHKTLIAFTWIAATVLFSSYFYTFKLSTRNGYNKCASQWSPAFDEKSARIIFLSIAIAVAFLIPFTSITVLYSIMLYTIRQGTESVSSMLTTKQTRTRRRRNRKIFFMSFTVVLAFLVLWGPFFFFMIVINFAWRWTVPISTQELQLIIFVVQFLGYLNSAVNPCIYFIYLKSFRQGIKNLFCRKDKNLERNMTLQPLRGQSLQNKRSTKRIK